MRIYVTTQGSSIVREGGHLLVRCGKDIHHTIFLHKVKQLVLCGNVSLTPSARNALFRNSIDTVFLTQNGRYLGRFSQPEPKNITLRKCQFAKAEETEFCLRFAKAVVAGKLANQAAVLLRIHRKHSDGKLAAQAEALRRIIDQLEDCASIDEVRGHEGQGSALYFSVFNQGFDTDQGFRKRVRRPPTDPVNAVLSLLYTFLYNLVYSAIRQVQLDPYLGSLHAVDYGRYSLVLDLMEEFRPILVDTLVFALFNMGVLKRNEDFVCEDEAEEEESENPLAEQAGESGNEFFDTPVQRIEERFTLPPSAESARRPVLLKPDSLKKVIAQFERKIATRFTYEPEDRKITYTEALVRQARLYRLCVEGSADGYVPLALR